MKGGCHQYGGLQNSEGIFTADRNRNLCNRTSLIHSIAGNRRQDFFLSQTTNFNNNELSQLLKVSNVDSLIINLSMSSLNYILYFNLIFIAKDFTASFCLSDILIQLFYNFSRW